MSFKPLSDNVLVKISEQEKTSEHGIILPGASKEKPNQGEVVAVGGGILLHDGTRVALEVKLGDVVVFRKGAGMSVDIEGASHIILRESDIFAVL